jgi:hypothetical protein
MFSGFGRAFDNAKAQTRPAVRHPADVDDGFFHILPSCITYQLPFDGEYPAAFVWLSLLAHQLTRQRGMIIGSVLVSRWPRF